MAKCKQIVGKNVNKQLSKSKQPVVKKYHFPGSTLIRNVILTCLLFNAETVDVIDLTFDNVANAQKIIIATHRFWHWFSFDSLGISVLVEQTCQGRISQFQKCRHHQ